MMRMISDLLALSRIDNKSTQLDVEMTNFTAFMTYILNRFDQIKSQETNTGKTYEIIRDYPVNSIWVEIDTDKMTQVVDNILNNAIKYSPDGGKITVSMKTTDSQLIVSISDQGLTVFTVLIRLEVVLRVELVLACPLQKKLLNNIRALFGLRVSMVRVQLLQLCFHMTRMP